MKNEIKRTKIIATLGPAVSSKEKIRGLIEAGANAFRLNFSHGSHENHIQLIRWIHELREEMAVPVGIMQDLSGPKIRIGTISNPPLILNHGDEFILDPELTESVGNSVPVSHGLFADDTEIGHHLLLADGAIELEILDIQHPRVICRILNGGQLTSKKGINYPGGSFNVPSITEKDKRDLKVGLENGVDFVAISFVRKVDDVTAVRQLCTEFGREVPLIAKIEKHEAIANFDGIINAVDGVIVARGDLGVEIPLEKVPSMQKEIIHRANLHGKPVIIATQMLASMVKSPRPTRAEVSDIANAILDGADALLLSEETAIGEYPVESVSMMARIAIEAERNYPFGRDFSDEEIPHDITISTAISSSAAQLASDLDAPVILCPTSSGFTARMISRFRPKSHIYALTSLESTYLSAGLLWGVIPRKVPMIESFDRTLMRASCDMANADGLLDIGERYVVTAGFPFGSGHGTNMMRAGIYEGKQENDGAAG